MAQFANPADIRKLSDWVARYGKYANVTLSETGEPIVLEAKKENPARVLTLPWNREGDVLTVLSNRSYYTQATVDVAAKRFADVTAPVNEAANQDALRAIERRLLEAWQSYRATPSIPLMRDVNGIEKELLAFERSIARPDRVVLNGRLMVPVMPLDERGIGIADVGGLKAKGSAVSGGSSEELGE
jgi:hypothetical protein